MNFPKQKNRIHIIFLFLSTVLFLTCKKQDAGTEVHTDLTKTVIASVTGFVTNESDMPVTGAAVKFGTSSTTTDKHGYFEINNAVIIQNAAFVTVTMNAYFKGIKTFITAAGKSSFCRIKLIRKSIAGTIDATIGGTVALNNGLKITLPANAVVTISTGTFYNGDINVATSLIDSSITNFNEIMPGDLRGIDINNKMKKVTPFGIAAVELTGTNGELLQIASGKKATLTIPVAYPGNSPAPAIVPLCYFDEARGLWIEDGKATKMGNGYIGEVSHFSWWGSFFWGTFFNATVPLTFSITDTAGHTMQDVNVWVTDISDPSSYTAGWADNSGYASLFVDPNKTYKLALRAFCGNYVYNQIFSAGTQPVNLGTLVLPGSVTATVTGNITDCNNVAVTNGYVLLQDGTSYQYAAVDNSGAFSFSTIICNATYPVILIGQNNTSVQQNISMPYTLIPGQNNIGTLQACGLNTTQFINYTINGGSNISFITPADTILHSNYTGLSWTNIGAHSNNNFISFEFDNTGAGAGTSQPLLTFSADSLETFLISTPINVNITEFGNVGEFISGNFSGTFTGEIPPNPLYTVTCSFRVRRNS